MSPDASPQHELLGPSEAALVVGLDALRGAMLTPYINAEAGGKSSQATIGTPGVRNRILVVGLIAGQPVWILVSHCYGRQLGGYPSIGPRLAKGDGILIRVYVDMVADLFHYGHVDFLRKAHALGDHLLVGICSDEAVQTNKLKNPY